MAPFLVHFFVKNSQKTIEGKRMLLLIQTPSRNKRHYNKSVGYAKIFIANNYSNLVLPNVAAQKLSWFRDIGLNYFF